MDDNFRIRLCSDVDYEEMVADISYGNHTVATITQEKGLDNMEIEIFPPEEGALSWKFALEDLVNIIQSAKKRLIEFSK